MHEIQTIAVSVPASVSLSCGFTQLSCANMAEWIEVPFWVEPFRDIALDGDPISPTDSMRPSPRYFDHLFSIC